jgi:hypothetical protein
MRYRTQPKLVTRSPRSDPSHSRVLIVIRVSFDVTAISVMSITMLQAFVFPSVTDVVITRHRQNIYLPVYVRRWRRAVTVVVTVEVEGTGGGEGEGVGGVVGGGGVTASEMDPQD